jgi:hypothetical protein
MIKAMRSKPRKGENMITQFLAKFIKSRGSLACFICTLLFIQQTYSQDMGFDLATRAGGPNAEQAYAIATDGSGNVYVTGYFSQTATFGSTVLSNLSGNHDIFITKIDNSGKFIWVIKADFSLPAGTAEGLGIAVDGSGYIFVTGRFSGQVYFGSTMLTSAGGTDIFIAKISNSGSFVWAKRAGGGKTMYTTYNDDGRGIAVDGAGHVFVTGTCSGTAVFGSVTLASGGIFVAKMDNSGNFIWVKQVGAGEGLGIAIDGSGNVFMTGILLYGLNDLNQDIFVVKLDASGNLVWSKQAGGFTADQGWGIAVDRAGNVFLTGVFSGTATFGSLSFTNNVGGYDIFIAKMNNSGNFVWVKQVGGTNADLGGYGLAIAADGSGNAYVTGYFSGLSQFGSFPLSSAGYGDIFVTKLDNTGRFIWAQRAGGSSSEEGDGIAVDGSGNVFVAGGFFGTAKFGSASITSAGDKDIFITKMKPQFPDIASDPVSWNFGSVNAGGNSGKQFSISNKGSANLNITAVTLLGSNASEFSLELGNALPFTIPVGSTTLDIKVRFKPTSTGSKSASLSIASNDHDENPFLISLTGTGVAASAPDIDSDPVSWNFGSVNIGNHSPKLFSISNTGNAILNTTAVTLTGANASEFSFQSGDNASFTIPVGTTTHSITVLFNPTSTGSKSATLKIASNDPDENPFNVSLTGTGTSGGTPDIACNFPNWNFGSVNLGSHSDKVFGVRNDGSASLNIISATLVGANASEFSIQSGGGSFSLASGEVRDITVRYTPASVGAKVAWLEIASNDPDENPYRIGMDGTGAAASAPDIASDPASWNYGSVNTGDHSDKMFSISNAGNANLTVASTTLTGANVSEFSIQNGGGAFTLASGASRNIMVRFSPTSAGSKSASLSMASNDPDENPFLINLSGTGGTSAAFIVIDGLKDNFYSQLTGPNDGYLQLRYYAWNDNGKPANDADLSAKIWTAWDSQWFYLYEEVKDNILSGNATNVWEEDCLELKVDPQATSEANSIWETRLTALDMGSAGVVSADNMSTLQGSQKQWFRKTVTGGYVLELAIQWSAIISGSETITPAAGNVFGMGINQHDNDAGAVRRATLQWGAVLLDAAWNTPKYLGTVKFLSGNKLQFIAKNNITSVTNPIPYDGSEYNRTGVEEASTAPPKAFTLEQNYPNPFNPSTTVRYQVPERSSVFLSVCDIQGHRLRTLVKGIMEPGSYTVQWDARDEAGEALPSGVYLCRLETSGVGGSGAVKSVSTLKMILLR